MAPRETENNAYAKFCGDKRRASWYVMVFSGVVNNEVLNPFAPEPPITAPADPSIACDVISINGQDNFVHYVCTVKRCFKPY